MLGSQLYHRFDHEDNWDSKMAELLREIGETLKISAPHPIHTEADVSFSLKQSSPKWTPFSNRKFVCSTNSHVA